MQGEADKLLLQTHTRTHCTKSSFAGCQISYSNNGAISANFSCVLNVPPLVFMATFLAELSSVCPSVASLSLLYSSRLSLSYSLDPFHSRLSLSNVVSFSPPPPRFSIPLCSAFHSPLWSRAISSHLFCGSATKYGRFLISTLCFFRCGD